jgi:hypothetical protein
VFAFKVFARFFQKAAGVGGARDLELTLMLKFFERFGV